MEQQRRPAGSRSDRQKSPIESGESRDRDRTETAAEHQAIVGGSRIEMTSCYAKPFEDIGSHHEVAVDGSSVHPKCSEVKAAALACSGDDQPTAGGSGDPDIYAAGEALRIGEEAASNGLEPQGREVPNANVGSAAGARAGDDLGLTIAIEVSGSNSHPASEALVVCEHSGDFGRVLFEHTYMRAAARPGAGDDLVPW